MADSQTAETFSPLVGGAFRVQLDGAPPVELELTSVERHDPNPGGARDEPFSLFFVGPVEPILPQAIYRFEHDALGEPEIFIVPIARDERGTTYEAVFN